MPLFVSPTCRGRRIGRIPLVYVLSSEDAHMYSSVSIDYNMDDVR